MATNTIVKRGGVEYVPPVSLAFLAMVYCVFNIIAFFFNEILKNKKDF